MLRNWDDLRIFLAVARTPSLSEAAATLGVSQPTVSRRLRDLEQRIGATLVERGADGHSLTPAGRQILSLVEDVDRSVTAIERRVVGADQRISGEVRVAATTGLARCWLVPRLAELLALHPALTVDVSAGVSLSDLLRREADVALRFGEPGAGTLVGRRLGRVSCGLYASRAYLQAHGEPRTPRELASHTIIESTRDIADLSQARVLRRLARGARCRIACDNIDVQVAAAQAGLGIVALTTYMRLGAPDLVRVLKDRFDVPLDLWLLTHEDLRESARVRVVLDFLFEAFQRDRERLADET